MLNATTSGNDKKHLNYVLFFSYLTEAAPDLMGTLASCSLYLHNGCGGCGFVDFFSCHCLWGWWPSHFTGSFLAMCYVHPHPPKKIRSEDTQHWVGNCAASHNVVLLLLTKEGGKKKKEATSTLRGWGPPRFHSLLTQLNLPQSQVTCQQYISRCLDTCISPSVTCGNTNLDIQRKQPQNLPVAESCTFPYTKAPPPPLRAQTS